MTPGERLGPYEILEQLGAGGMGEVWLAEDTRLGRKVAVKVLPAQFASDPERLARFEQEARAAAALNHPHIAAVYDVGAEPGADDTSTHFIVQEYLEGESLRDLLDRGAPERRKALALGMEIGEALKAAHRAGIVHRDLKPENVFVTPDGHAKVLDFGLAKLTEMNTGPLDSQSMSPTVLGTQAGAIMGTAGYMAPEQVQGEEVDARADVFALGCVLWEMVSGQRAFAGKSVPHTLHKILDEEPEGSDTEIGKGLPLRLRWLLERALAKNPEERTQSAGDVVAELRQVAAEVDSGTAITEAAALSGEPQPVVEAGGGGVPWKAAVPAGVVLVLLSLLGATLLAPAVPEPVVRRFEIEYPETGGIRGGFSRGVTISPDGRWIVLENNGQLWLRGIGDMEPTLIRGADPTSRTPTFSPDSQNLAFYSNSQFRRIPTSGGAPVALADITGERPHDARWAADGYIYFGQGPEGITRVPENGGVPETVVEAGAGSAGAQLLPGGEWLLGTLRTEEPEIFVQSLKTGERRVVSRGGVDGRYVPTGHLLFMVESDLLAQPFDLDTLEVSGGPVVVVEGLRTSGSAVGDYAVSDEGHLVYRPGGTSGGDLVPAWIDSRGNVDPLPLDARSYDQLRSSPDGSRIAAVVQGDIWLYEVERGGQQRLTSDGASTRPVWSADGQWIYFRNPDDNVWRRRADLSSPAEPYLEMEGTQAPSSFSADGQLLVIDSDVSSNRDLLLVALDGEPDPQPLVAPPANEFLGSLSPDGRYVAYASNESGEVRIYVQELATNRQWPVSTGPGQMPFWSAQGDRIFFRVASVTSVPITTEPEFAAGTPEPGVSLSGRNRFFYHVHPDGSRILFYATPGTDSEAEGEPRLQVVLNWFEELKTRVPVGS